MQMLVGILFIRCVFAKPCFPCIFVRAAETFFFFALFLHFARIIGGASHLTDLWIHYSFLYIWNHVYAEFARSQDPLARFADIPLPRQFLCDLLRKQPY